MTKFLLDSPFLEFLHPWDLIKLLHVNKAARRAAIPQMKKRQVQAVAQTERFEKFLARSQTHPSSYGPRSTSGGGYSQSLTKNFVILSYERSQILESSSVALFDDRGTFVAFYELLENRLLLGDFLVSNNEYCHDYDWHIATTGSFNSRRHNRWELKLVDSVPPFVTDTLLGFRALCDQYHDTFYPAESMSILMHALSSDPRIICTMATSVSDALNQIAYHLPGHRYAQASLSDGESGGQEDSEQKRLEEWLECLASVKCSDPIVP